MKPIFTRRRLVRTAFVCALAATVVAAIYAIENWRGERAWDRYRAESEKRGIALDDRARRDAGTASKRESELDLPAEGAFLLPGDMDAGQWISRADNGAACDLEKLSGELVRTGLLKKRSANPAADVLAGLKRYEPALQQMSDAAPRLQTLFPVDWPEPLPAGLHHLDLVGAVNLLAIRAEAFLASGNSGRAREELQTVLQLVHALGEEPSLLFTMVRVVMVTIVDGVMWSGLGQDGAAGPAPHVPDAENFALLPMFTTGADPSPMASMAAAGSSAPRGIFKQKDAIWPFAPRPRGAGIQ